MQFTQSLRTTLFIAALSTLASAQINQLLPIHKTADLLIGDTTGSMVLRAHDGNTNGNFNDAGELTVFFDPAVALDPNTSLPYGAAKLATPAAMTLDLRGWVYVCDSSSSRTIFRLRDNNGDGDANDPGESTIYFDGSNAQALSNFSMSGIAFDMNGFAFVTASGQGSGFTTIDRIFRLIDFNSDGDANDLGEAAVVFDRTAAIANGNASIDIPAWIGFNPDGSLFVTNANSTNQGVFRLTDTPSSANGLFQDAGEVTSMYGGANSNPAPKFSFCARYGVDGRLFLYNITDKRLIVATDGNTNGVFDDAGEAAPFFTNGDSGIAIGAGFGFDVRDDGAVVFGDTGGSPSNRLILLKDGNGNGVASDLGEATVILNFPTSAFAGAKPRSLLFLPALPPVVAPGCPAMSGLTPELGIDLDGGGIPKAGNSGFRFKMTSAPVGVGVAILAAETIAPLDLNTYVPGISPPGCILYPDLLSPTTIVLAPAGVTDGSGTLLILVPIPANPAIQGGTLFCGGITIDPGSPTPVITTTTIAVTFL